MKNLHETKTSRISKKVAQKVIIVLRWVGRFAAQHPVGAKYL
jgi:hypothetical protein